ncbi:MAG: N-acetylmuramoyl-L-alanine amidase [Verrucomicrobiota bacterium]|nr:N-acetylmuramoyl-L-alanine amidase [Verrucomicrobiota bacterium]
MITRAIVIAIGCCGLVSLGAADSLSPLSQAPDWSALEKYQETMTHEEFIERLQDIYCPRGLSPDLLVIDENVVRILTSRGTQSWFTLRFANSEKNRKPVKNDWRSVALLSRAKKGRELSGWKIALDPGHIGGSWARMEERWFQVGDARPIQEGDMTLLVAKLLAPKLEKLGATVSFVRDKLEPSTPKRPDDMKEVSREVLLRAGNVEPRENFDGPGDPQKEQTLRWQDELLFYRNSEIRARATKVNTKLKPDVVLCLHFNAEVWDDPAKPTLTDHNHLHLLVNGSYLPAELEFDDVRFEMVRRLLSRTFDEEFPLAENCARAMARRTQLPPYQYTTENVTNLGQTGYVYARNLLATRLFQCPVVYFEPFVMNSDEVFWRVEEGDYEGSRNVNGTERPSIFREYADGVVDGLVDYCRTTRGSGTMPR